MPAVEKVIVWLLVGLLSGSLAALIITRQRAGFGRLSNLGLGLAGALVGGFLFWLFNFLPGLDRIAISLRDVVSAFVGSLIVVAAIWSWHYFKRAA
jgi:uncharacterized membrane protein YeaQ/YmgE (transglycosylase-associated protein family)